MGTDNAGFPRQSWVMAGIAASVAILVFRTVGALVLLIRSVWPWPPVPSLYPFVHWGDIAHLLVGLLASVLCIYMMDKFINGKSGQARLMVLIIVGILAILPNPVRFQEGTLVDYQTPQVSTTTQNTNSNISLVCRLMNSQTPGSQVLITERNVESARPMAWDDTTYCVVLVLDQEGSKTMRKVTAGAVGNNIGFWIDGVLVASPEIMAPLTAMDIAISINGKFDLQKAQEISRRFNARKR